MKTKIILGVSIAAAVVFGGLFLLQVRKSGMDAESQREDKKARKQLAQKIEVLENLLEQSYDSVAAAEAFLTDARAEVSKRIALEKIYIDKIKMDSTTLKEIQISNAKNDSLRKHFTAEQWHCYIANQLGENCN